MSEYDDTDPHLGDDDDDDKMGGPDIKNEDGTGETKKTYDAKDPLRPRRKKARRACYACQRAHLTCGMPPFSARPLSSCFGGRRGRPRPRYRAGPEVLSDRSYCFDAWTR